MVVRGAIRQPTVRHLPINGAPPRVASTVVRKPIGLDSERSPIGLAAAALGLAKQIQAAVCRIQDCAWLTLEAHSPANFVILPLVMIITRCLKVPVIKVRKPPLGMRRGVGDVSHVYKCTPGKK